MSSAVLTGGPPSGLPGGHPGGARPPSGESGGSGPSTARVGRAPTGHRRRWRGPLLWSLVAAAVVVAVSLLSVRSVTRTGFLDPDSAQDTGALALHSVLSAQGIDVEVARSQRELLAASVGPGTTVLISATDNLAGSTARTARQHIAGAARLVLVEPGALALTGLGVPLDPEYDARYAPVQAGCREPDAQRAGAISGGDVTYSTRAQDSFAGGPADGAVSCFPGRHGAYEVALPGHDGSPAVTVLGSADVLANHHVADSGNAALALGLLGDTRHLLWYVPTADDIPVTDQSTISTALPRWLSPARLLAVSALLALMLWRGRRFGRLVPEPLPVVVTAVETTQSRGRMYRKAADRGRAVAVLQAGTRDRLARYLGLPHTSAPSTLISAVSAVTGRPLREVGDLLVTATAPDDPSLLDLAGRLAALEKEVRRT